MRAEIFVLTFDELEKYKARDMHDLLDNAFNITDRTLDTIREWLYTKVSASHTTESSVFVSLVIYPKLLKR